MKYIGPKHKYIGTKNKYIVLHVCGAYSIRRTFKSSKNEKLFNASKEFHISD